MSKIAEQKALEAYPIAYYRNGGGIDDANSSDRAVYEEGYDQAVKNVFEWIEKNIPCGEMSSEDVRSFIKECKEYFKGED